MLPQGTGVNHPRAVSSVILQMNPTTFRTFWARLLVIVGWCALTAGSLPAEVWHQYYAEAEAALANEQWSRVVEKINLALESRGDSSARARTYGMNFIEYFPYLKLGMAYFHLGRLHAAEQAFETEEKLGAIQQSRVQLADMRRYQNLIRTARQRAATEEQRRIETIVAENMKAASELEGSREFEKAIAAISNVLALRPEDAVAMASMTRLQGEMSRLEAEREAGQEATRLVEEGKRVLAAGDFQHAISAFERALTLNPTDEVKNLRAEASYLRDQSRAKLRDQLRAAEDEENRAQWIADALTDALSMESRGDFEQALRKLQSVLALDPENRTAMAVQMRLSQAVAAADREQARRNLLRTLERQLQSRWDVNDYEEALLAGNRILAIDPDNRLARGLISRAYREIGRELLGNTVKENFPPAIRFADFRKSQLDDGLQVETVDTPGFRLTGTIFDDAPVEVSFEMTSASDATETIQGENHVQQLEDNFLNVFTLTHRLDPGLSVFRIGATDPEGLTSSSDYAVLYLVPWYRSAWIFTVSGIALAIIGFAFYARRINRSRRLRHRHFNPYIAGAPVLDEALFFGREKLVQRILQTIHNNSLLLFGERRIGKTSLQHHLKKRLLELRDPDYDFYPVYIDLQGTPQERFFATLGQDVMDELAPHLVGFVSTAPTPDEPDYSYRDLVRDLRQVVKVLREGSAKRIKLVLLIDEVDELNAYDPRINQRLRSLFMKSFADNLVAVVSGVGIKKQWDSQTSPWYNFFEEIEVQPFARRDAEKLIFEPISGVFRIQPRAVDRIIELTDCRPYHIQKMCIHLVNRLHEEDGRTITLRHVEDCGRIMEA